MLLALTKVLTDSADGATLLCIVLAQANFVSEFMKAVFCARCESQTFRTQDLSFPRTKSPYGELSSPGNESSWNFHSRDLSFTGAVCGS